MKTPYDRLAKIYTNCTGHTAKMATMFIYGKNPLNIFISGTKRPMALGLGMLHWGWGPYQICTKFNDESRMTLTYIMARSNLIPDASIWEKSWNVHFSITVLAEIIILSRIVKPNETMVLCKYQMSSWPVTFYPRPLTWTATYLSKHLFLRNHWAVWWSNHKIVLGHLTKMAATPIKWNMFHYKP